MKNLHEVDVSDRAFNIHDDSLLISTTLKILVLFFFSKLKVYSLRILLQLSFLSA